MALFALGAGRCSICREVIRVGDDVIATTHFIGDDADPLSRHSDTVMHRSCFESWKSRDEFARRYRETMTAIFPDAAGYAEWPGPAGSWIVEAPPPPAPPSPPSHFCPECNAGLSVARQIECANCGWLRHPSDRTRWGRSGPCPGCGFSYRFDGSACSHCGRSGAVAPRPGT